MWLKNDIMVYVTLPNGTSVWENSSQIFANITNSTSPIGAIGQTINTGLPWFWPFLIIALYLWMYLIYSDAPSGGRFYMICALVLVISVFLSLGGNILNAVINFMIFAIVFFLSNQFKHV